MNHLQSFIFNPKAFLSIVVVLGTFYTHRALTQASCATFIDADIRRGSNATLIFDIQGLQPCTDYNQTILAGSTALMLSGSLEVVLTDYQAQVGDTFVICKNVGTESIVGQFDQIKLPDILTGEWRLDYPQSANNPSKDLRLMVVESESSITTNPVPQPLLRMYPNPASSTIYIEWSKEMSQLDIILDIVDAQGQIKKTITMSGGGTVLIDIQDLPVGYYLLKSKSLDIHKPIIKL